MSNGNSMIEDAQFIERTECISCGSSSLTELSTGLYNEDPLHEYLSADPWGENPIPFLLNSRWSFVQCNNCNQAFHKYILAPDWNERRFSQWMSQEAIESFERNLNTPERLFNKGIQNTKHILQLERLTRDLRGNAPLRLLDFGCGYGEFIEMCSLYGFEVFGIDRSSARRNNANFGKIFPDIENLKDLGNREFHVITLFEVLEHLDDPKSLLKVLKEYLIKGGILVIETPDCAGIKGISSLSDYRQIHPLEHINAFTSETMRKLVESLGFVSIKKPVSHVTTDPVRVIKTEIKRIIGGVLRTNTQQYFQKL